MSRFEKQVSAACLASNILLYIQLSSKLGTPSFAYTNVTIRNGYIYGSEVYMLNIQPKSEAF